MKRLGLIGGMSWQSTMPYYEQINQQVAETLGSLHSAPMIVWNMNFQQIADLQKAGDWEEANHQMTQAAIALETAGAESIVICTNTMHKSVPAMKDHIQIPILHIADAAGKALVNAGIQRVGLLGTRFTMEQGFYADHLKQHFGLDVIIPSLPERQIVHDVIFKELCIGIESESSRRQYQEIMAGLVANGAEAILLGCTEIVQLVGPSDATVPVFDTTALHAAYAAHWCLGKI